MTRKLEDMTVDEVIRACRDALDIMDERDIAEILEDALTPRQMVELIARYEKGRKNA